MPEFVMEGRDHAAREEYALAGMGGAYWSQRPFAGWN
jgi:hypothetical protein